VAVSRRVAALCGSAGVALLALSGAALADDKLSWSASLTGTSDYVFRGISQTDQDPTIQGSVGLQYDMFYAGAWASGLDWGDAVRPTLGEDAQIEVDWYGGIKPVWKHSPLGEVSFDLGVIYYTYPGATDPAAEADYVELKAGYSLPSPFIKNLTTGGTFYWSPDYSFETGSVWTSESTASYALPKVWVFDPTISGLLGYQKGEDANYNGGGKDHYYYWNAGLTLAVENVSFDFRYWDTDLDPVNGGLCGTGPLQCDERFVFSTTLTLP
jgi:uncharacterized protein (TIGR02001 family)